MKSIIGRCVAVLSVILVVCVAFLRPVALGGDEGFSFAVVTDPHAAEEAKWEVEKYGSHVDRFLRCVEAMEKLPPTERPDFVLVTGDIHLWKLRKHFDRISIPLHVIAGNHEADRAKRKEMRELFPEDFQINGKPSDYYAFVRKTFIGVCDAGRGGDHIGHLASEDIIPRGQCEWLERELSKEERHKFIFAHIPPHPKSKDVNMYLSRNDCRYFNELVERTQPTALFFGHLHGATKENKIGKARSFTVRSCAWNFNGAALGFLLVRVSDWGIDVREILTSE